MNKIAFEGFARRASDTKVVASEFEALCTAEGVTHLALFDALAKHIALGYSDSGWSFQQADAAMNNLWGLLISQVKGGGWEIPEYFYAVYEAFDAGEHRHSGDPDSINPEEQYTKPRIAALLDKT